jgi:hypothetical protein
MLLPTQTTRGSCKVSPEPYMGQWPSAETYKRLRDQFRKGEATHQAVEAKGSEQLKTPLTLNQEAPEGPAGTLGPRQDKPTPPGSPVHDQAPAGEVQGGPEGGSLGEAWGMEEEEGDNPGSPGNPWNDLRCSPYHRAASRRIGAQPGTVWSAQ